MSRWIDLSHELAPGMPTYPGDPDITFAPAATVTRDGYEVHSLRLGTHSGTHVDAPSHFIAGGRTVDQIAPAELIGDALVLHFQDAAANSQIKLEDARPQFGQGLGDARIVLVTTGWDRFWGTEAYFSQPTVSPELATHLRDLGMRVLGIDTPSPDPIDSEDCPAHVALLGTDALVIENLRSLTGLPNRVDFIGVPLRLAGLDGSPIRAVARPRGN